MYDLFWYFTIYAFLGWCVEVCFCSINTGHFVNRGFLNGPVCPIYGFGMLALIVCLEPIADNILLLFAGAVLLTSLLELLTGFALKKLFSASWWDYSEQRFNLGGYICLKFSLCWGVGGVLAIRVLHPLVVSLRGLVPRVIGLVLAAIMVIIFVCDIIVTLSAIAKLKKDLGRIADIAKLAHKGSELLAKSLGSEAVAMNERVDEGKEALDSAKVSIDARLDILKAEIQDGADFTRRRLLQAFPHLKPNEYSEFVQQLREWYQKARSKEK